MRLFKLLSFSKVNWLLGEGEKKKCLEKLPDWAAWLCIIIWIEERQLTMSEEEEVLQETSVRHLCFRCFLPILTHFVADPRGYSKQTFLIHTAATLLFVHGFGSTICTVISSQAPPSWKAYRKKSTTVSYAVKQRNNYNNCLKVCKWAVHDVCWHPFLRVSSLPEDTDQPMQLITRGWCLSSRSSMCACIS